MRVLFYIDGFNLYYGACKRNGGKYKWLNLEELAKRLMPNADIVKIKYFTAKIKNDPNALYRQTTYLRALQSLSKVQIIEGKYLFSYPFMRVKTLPPPSIQVIKSEEKGTDVNIASHILIDGFKDEYDAVALITNDSDFVYQVNYIVKDLKKSVYIFNPQIRPSYDLKKVATKVNDINTKTLASSLFSDDVVLPNGKIVKKPITW